MALSLFKKPNLVPCVLIHYYIFYSEKEELRLPPRRYARMQAPLEVCERPQSVLQVFLLSIIFCSITVVMLTEILRPSIWTLVMKFLFLVLESWNRGEINNATRNIRLALCPSNTLSILWSINCTWTVGVVNFKLYLFYLVKNQWRHKYLGVLCCHLKTFLGVININSGEFARRTGCFVRTFMNICVQGMK